MEQVEYKPTSALQWCVMKTSEAIGSYHLTTTSQEEHFTGPDKVGK